MDRSSEEEALRLRIRDWLASNRLPAAVDVAAAAVALAVAIVVEEGGDPAMFGGRDGLIEQVATLTAFQMAWGAPDPALPGRLQ